MSDDDYEGWWDWDSDRPALPPTTGSPDVDGGQDKPSEAVEPSDSASSSSGERAQTEGRTQP